MLAPTESIYFPRELRLRMEYGDIDEMKESLRRYGQLQPILVRPFDPEEWLGVDGPFEWVVTDGGRRMTAVTALHAAGAAIRFLPPGQINIYSRPDDDPLFALELEFYATETRKEFTWKEKAEFVKRIHEAHMAANAKWDVYLTSAILGMSEITIRKYLALTEDDEVFNDERVQKADTFTVAYKKRAIVRDLKRRDEIAKEAKASGRSLLGKFDSLEDVEERARHAIKLGDARELIKEVPNSTYDWVHWDPPYGGGQIGNDVRVIEGFDDTEEYSIDLITTLFPELWRVMNDGAWMVYWYHPKFHHRSVALLQGHKFEENMCVYCGAYFHEVTRLYECPKSPTRMWVNPYPNIWHKVNRVSDGHEIRRFLTNSYEPFLLSCKHVEVEPILPFSSGHNVFPIPIVEKSLRRHPTQKPVELMHEILKVISVRASYGFDPCMGSGTIADAAFGYGRNIEGFEIDPNFYPVAIDSAMQGLARWGEDK